MPTQQLLRLILGTSNTKFRNSQYDHNSIEYEQKNNKNWINAFITAKSNIVEFRVCGYTQVIYAIAQETDNLDGIEDQFDGRAAAWKYNIADPNCINKLRKTVEIAFKHFKI